MRLQRSDIAGVCCLFLTPQMLSILRLLFWYLVLIKDVFLVFEVVVVLFEVGETSCLSTSATARIARARGFGVAVRRSPGPTGGPPVPLFFSFSCQNFSVIAPILQLLLRPGCYTVGVSHRCVFQALNKGGKTLSISNVSSRLNMDKPVSMDLH